MPGETAAAVGEVTVAGEDEERPTVTAGEAAAVAAKRARWDRGARTGGRRRKVEKKSRQRERPATTPESVAEP